MECEDGNKLPEMIIYIVVFIFREKLAMLTP